MGGEDGLALLFYGGVTSPSLSDREGRRVSKSPRGKQLTGSAGVLFPSDLNQKGGWSPRPSPWRLLAALQEGLVDGVVDLGDRVPVGGHEPIDLARGERDVHRVMLLGGLVERVAKADEH